MAFDVANRSRTTQGVPQGVCYEPEEADCSAGKRAEGELSCLSRLACNFIIAFRCMFPAVAFALAINRRLIAHVPSPPHHHLPLSALLCPCLRRAVVHFTRTSRPEKTAMGWERDSQEGLGEGGETKLRFN